MKNFENHLTLLSNAEMEASSFTEKWSHMMLQNIFLLMYGISCVLISTTPMAVMCTAMQNISVQGSNPGEQNSFAR